MKRLLVAVAVAGAFASSAFAQVASSTAYYAGHLFANAPTKPDPAPHKVRATAWIDNRAKDFGNALAARWQRMKKATDGLARRASRDFHYATRVPA